MVEVDPEQEVRKQEQAVAKREAFAENEFLQRPIFSTTQQLKFTAAALGGRWCTNPGDASVLPLTRI